MTPVILLSDGYIANGAEPWMIPDVDALKPFPVKFHTEVTEDFHPYQRDEETLSRVWVKPGTEGLQHRIGGLEKNRASGHISYDPNNHHEMTMLRAQKIKNVANEFPDAEVDQGDDEGDVLVIGWGGTYGSISQAVRQSRKDGKKVSHYHLRNIWPLPNGLGELMKRFDTVVVAELNNGQLARLLRSEYLVDCKSVAKVAGQPFRISELGRAIDEHLKGGQ